MVHPLYNMTKSHLNVDTMQSVKITIYVATPTLIYIYIYSGGIFAQHLDAQQYVQQLRGFCISFGFFVAVFFFSCKTIEQLFTVSIKLVLSFANLLSLF